MKKQRLEERIKDIKKRFLTSQDIVDRIQHPYYFNQANIPYLLTRFKHTLDNYRRVIASLIAKEPSLPLPNAVPTLRDFSEGTFAHQLSVGLTVSLLGVGECGECTARLGHAIVQEEVSSLAFVAIEFSKAQIGMEQTHTFIIVNLPTFPESSKQAKNVESLFKTLPADSLVADAFLGLVFSPHNVPEKFNHYIHAYGGETAILQCHHLFNLPKQSKLFNGYWAIAMAVSASLKQERKMIESELYPFSERKPISDTMIIRYLQMKSKLPFFGICDDNYTVDAIVEVSNEQAIQAVIQLQRNLRGYGRFFTMPNKKEGFVLENINDSKENIGLIEAIQALKIT